MEKVLRVRFKPEHYIPNCCISLTISDSEIGGCERFRHILAAQGGAAPDKADDCVWSHAGQMGNTNAGNEPQP